MPDSFKTVNMFQDICRSVFHRTQVKPFETYGIILARGNVAVCNEFNFHCDPEAVHVVLMDSGIIPFIVPLETCLEYQLSWVRISLISISYIIVPTSYKLKKLLLVYYILPTFRFSRPPTSNHNSSTNYLPS